MASNAAPVAESSKPTPDKASDTKQPQAPSKGTASNSVPAQSPADDKPAPNKDSTKDAKSQGKKTEAKAPAVKPENPKPVVHGDLAKRERMQQLLTLWTEFQQAQKLHSERIRDMDERLKRAEKTVEHFGKFCGEYHLLWKVKEFRRCYEEAASEVRQVIYSPVFDTHRNGYKLQMSICPAGDGKGRGVAMSVFFAILKGPYDALLSWPFTCPVTVTLLDQSSSVDPQHQGPPHDIARTFTPNPRPENEPFLGRPVEDRNISLGFPKFVQLTELFDGHFISDDTIYFKVHVDISALMQ